MNNNLEPLKDITNVIQNRRKKAFENKENRRLFFNLMRTILILGIFTFFVMNFFSFRIVENNDMFPFISDGDLSIGYKSDNLQKNDVVYYKANNQLYLGRIVAKGGDYIDITTNGDLIVNGSVQKGEIVFATYPKENFTPIQLQDNEYFILGDYRTIAIDSRDFGCIKKENIDTKIICIIRHRKF